jgi:hypothetical protein
VEGLRAYAHLKSRCDEALDAVHALSSSSSAHQVDLGVLRQHLKTSLGEFNTSAGRAIKRLYAGPRRAKGYHHHSSSGSDDSQADVDAVERSGGKPDGPNETVFLIYL